MCENGCVNNSVNIEYFKQKPNYATYFIPKFAYKNDRVTRELYYLATKDVDCTGPHYALVY